MAKILKRRALNKPLPTVIFEHDEQYLDIQKQLHEINQSLSLLSKSALSARKNLVTGILAKVYQQENSLSGEAVARAMYSNANLRGLHLLLKYNVTQTYPKLEQIAKSLVDLEQKFSHKFD